MSMAFDDDAPVRRRGDVDPAVELYVQEAVRETRHALRNDLAVLGTKIETGQILSSKEHTEVKSKLDQLTRDVSELKPLPAKVAALETADAVDHAAQTATEKLLTRQRTQFYLLAGLIVSAAGAAVGAIAALHG